MARPSSWLWSTSHTTGQELTPGELGGNIVPLLAGATLNIGDAVYLSADLTVNKSTTAGNKLFSLGIVVGGKRTNSEPAMENYSAAAILAGVQAAQVGELVWVLTRGVAYVILDAAIPVGTQLAFSGVTAGRLIAGTAYTIAAGATAVTSSAANGAIISGDGLGGVFAQLLQASSGAGQVRKAYVLN